jgi:hypothetical protein
MVSLPDRTLIDTLRGLGYQVKQVTLMLDVLDGPDPDDLPPSED